MHANVRFDLRIVRWYYKIIIKEKPLSNVKNDMGDDIMVLEHLECFLTVARYMNFTKAAKSMFLSQSTLSRNISELENDLGVKLFNRNNRFVKLTPAGETLLRMAPSLLQEIKKMEERVYASGTDTVGVLHVDMPRIWHIPGPQRLCAKIRTCPYASVALHTRQPRGGLLKSPRGVDRGVFI